ncbi:MAG: apolipoprotein N-acyltransferase, partial [Proteobacteria bacterium]|nr:apolipoprotein N-acyltransferase [Pseudomonadota bacterium]
MKNIAYSFQPLQKTFYLRPLYVQGISFVLGSLACLALAPFHIIFVLWLSLSGLLYLLDQAKSYVQAFFVGWFFGLGYFVFGLYWLSSALMIVDMWYLIPFAVLGLPILLALMYGLVTLATYQLSSKRLSRFLTFTSSFCIVEWLRGHILTGFPWNLMGYVWDLPMLQTTAWIGIYGLTLLTVVSACVLYTRHLLTIIVLNAALFICWLYGSYRLSINPSDLDTSVNIRLIQPSIAQSLKWDPKEIKNNLQIQILLSTLTPEKPLHAVIWPEAAIPAFIEENKEVLSLITTAIPKDGVLIAGAPRKEYIQSECHVWSSLFVINDKGHIKQTYDKMHLVPFGEYIPFKSWLPITKITYGDIDFSAGSNRSSIKNENIPAFSPLICYEGIFPSEVLSTSQAYWLLNLTNDAW